MRLLEVETRHWRGLSQTLQALSPRLTLVLGPNESGKSRLFEAIQFALFESHRGNAQHKQQLQNWTSSDSPFVRLGFEVEGRSYELQKQFLRGATAQLVGAGATLRGEEAEATLRGLLGTRTGGARRAGVEDLGVWPLLMVAQGDSRRSTGEHLNEDGRARLHERLSSEIGIAAISDRGKRLLSRAQAEYERYFTPSGQEASVLRQARQELAEAESTHQRALASHQHQEQTAAQLTEARAELDSLEQRFQTARTAAEQARSRAMSAQAAAARLATAEGTLNTAVVETTGAQSALTVRQEADQVAERLHAEAARCATQVDSLKPRQAELETAARQAEQAAATAETDTESARAALEAARRERHRTRLAGQRTELLEKVERLGAIDQQLQQLREQRSQLPTIDKPAVDELRRLDQVARTAEARLHGAAARLILEPLRELDVDGTTHPAGARIEIEVISNRTVILGGVANIEISPGRGTLDQLRDAQEQAQHALASALRAHTVGTLQQALDAHETVSELTGQIEQLTREARSVSSKSRTALSEEIAGLEAELKRLGPEVTPQGNEETLARAVQEREAAATAARAVRDIAQTTARSGASELALLAATQATKLEEHGRLTARYADRPTVAVLSDLLEQAVERRQHAQQILDQRRREFDDLGGEQAQRDATRLMQAADGLAGRLRDARGAVERLGGTLAVTMEAGAYESLQDTGARLEQSRIACSRLERHAAAARRLWTVLSEERQRVVERLTAPVIERVRPYLVNMFPGCTLSLGEDLGLIGLQTQALAEPFDALSGGAQEQLALLTRLGMIEVLAGEGTLPVILDDALINSDAERIQRIHRALFRAADKLQVLLFSCHEVLFDGLGAEQLIKLMRVRR